MLKQVCFRIAHRVAYAIQTVGSRSTIELLLFVHILYYQTANTIDGTEGATATEGVTATEGDLICTNFIHLRVSSEVYNVLYLSYFDDF